MINIKRIVRIYWPILLLIFLEGLLVGVNITPNTHLVGWDNMFPEFDFTTNIKRTLFATWQEYRGFGYQDGMSHAANLIHYLLLWIMSGVIPQQILRYAFVFGMHLLGGVGMYFLISNFKFQISNEKIQKVISFIGALVYQYCFATVQMFYLPFELFLVQFASLPWLFLTLTRFLRSGKRIDAVLFGIVTLLATPQAHVPTVFLVTVIAEAIMLLWYLVISKGTCLRRILMVICIIFSVNAFWGLPFTYNTITRSQVITGSKNNEIATADTFEKNRAFGNFLDTAEMKSFALTYIQYDHTKQTNEYMMKPWIEYIHHPAVVWSLLILFGLACFGGICSLIKRETAILPYTIIFLFAYTVIGNDIPIISSISFFMRTYIPLASDIFRFVFTKFFFLYAWTFAILCSYGLLIIISALQKKWGHATLSCTIIGILLIGITTFPSFQGNFIDKNLRVQIPDEYFQMFTYLRNQPEDERILILPMPWYWAWTQYRWGTIGSGFTWFGIRQPTIDRAFDPWSNFNEEAYWELSQAIYQKNTSLFMQLLTKYDIRWIMVDENIMHPTNDKALYISTIETMLEKGNVNEMQQFGRIRLFAIPKQTTTFIRTATNMPNIGPAYYWNDRDQGYMDTNGYITTTTYPYTIYYPFRSLFTGHEQNEKEFSVAITDDAITFTNTIPSGTEILTNSPIASDEANFAITYQKDEVDKIIATIPIVDTNTIYDSHMTTDLQAPIKSCDASRTGPITSTWVENNDSYQRVESANASGCIHIDLPDISQRYGYLVAINSRHITGRRLYISITNHESKRTFLESYVTDKKTNTDFTDSFFIIPPMDTYGQGYLVTLDNLSVNTNKTINDIASVRVYRIPYEEMVGMRFQPSDISRQTSAATITISSVEHPNPAYYKIQLTGDNEQRTENTNTLILSQSYDEGWHAYAVGNFQFSIFPASPAGGNFQLGKWLGDTFPFVFGEEIKEHVLVNNWSNGWTMSKTTDNEQGTENTIVLFFLPQLLEWIGFLVLPLPFFFLFTRRSF